MHCLPQTFCSLQKSKLHLNFFCQLSSYFCNLQIRPSGRSNKVLKTSYFDNSFQQISNYGTFVICKLFRIQQNLLKYQIPNSLPGVQGDQITYYLRTSQYIQYSYTTECTYGLYRNQKIFQSHQNGCHNPGSLTSKSQKKAHFVPDQASKLKIHKEIGLFFGL